VETVSLFWDRENLQKNLEAFNVLTKSLGPVTPIPDQKRNERVDKWNDGACWQNIPAERVVEFLENYKTHPEALKVNSKMLAEFIREMSKTGELTNWMIAVTGGSSNKIWDVGGINVKLMKRKANQGLDERYSIGRLLSPQDEAMDLDEAAWNAALRLTLKMKHDDPGRLKNGEEPKIPTIPNGPAIRRVRGFGAAGISPHPERGLLMISLLDPKMAEHKVLSTDLPPVVAIAISFPGSNSGNKVEYKVNNILWEQEYGAAE